MGDVIANYSQMQMILIHTNGRAKSRLYDIVLVGRQSPRCPHRNEGWLVRCAQGPGIGIDEPSGTIEARAPIAIVKRFDSHAAAARRRVQEATVSYIDSHVRVSARQRVEEHQVAGLELRAV